MVCVFAALVGIAIGLFVPAEWRAAWLVVGLGVSIAFSFGVQLAYGRSQGYIRRAALGMIGALLVLGVLSLGFGLAAIVPG